jgi:hypothetical protein
MTSALLCRISCFGLLLILLTTTPAPRAQLADVAEIGDSFGSAVATGDFDGDGRDDLAVGVPWEDVGPADDAGAVNVVYGVSGSGLAVTGNQLWTQDVTGVLDIAELGDHFGATLTVGDFDGDGRDDLAIGVSGEDIGPIVDAGAVAVLYGTPSGLSASANQFWHQDAGGILDAAESSDGFGHALAAGDFDGDAFDDLAVGMAGESVGALPGAGAVNVLYGTFGPGLTATGNQLWHQDVAGVLDEAEAGDFFGVALAAGDFDGDGFSDLAAGVPNENIPGTLVDAGAVNVLYGISGAGLSATDNQRWNQDAGTLADTGEEGDDFGRALAVGDFDGNGRDDLAIGVPNENVGEVPDGGAVNVLYGASGSGLGTLLNDFWHQDLVDIPDVAEDGDRFGSALTTGDFDGNGADDLAVGVADEDLGSLDPGAGVVNVLYGARRAGLTAAGSQLWHQDVAGVLSETRGHELFGSAVAGGDFDGDGAADLAVGIENERFGDDFSPITSGAAAVLYGVTGTGLTATGNQLWHQSLPPAPRTLPGGEAAAVPAGAPAGPALLRAAPNPFADRTAIRFTLPTAGTVRLAVYDGLGREVARLVDGAMEAGEHAVAFKAGALPAGVYLVRLATGGGLAYTQRVTLLR